MSDPAALVRLEAATGYRQTTLQKAARVLAGRGWIVLVRAGKNWLTREERRELRSAGSTARQRRNVWACTVPKHLRTADAVDNHAPGSPNSHAGCALPTTRRVGGEASVSRYKIFKPDQASRNSAARQASTARGRRRRAYRADLRTVELAHDLKSRVYWLRKTLRQRIMPALDQFAEAGWRAVDIQRELDRMLAARGWEVPLCRRDISEFSRPGEGCSGYLDR